jgi:hypothetical protein
MLRIMMNLVSDLSIDIDDLRIDPYRRPSSAMLRIMMNLVSDLGIDIGDLRIDLIVDLLLACRSACYLAN